jgi:hypothetical protein
MATATALVSISSNEGIYSLGQRRRGFLLLCLWPVASAVLVVADCVE